MYLLGCVEFALSFTSIFFAGCIDVLPEFTETLSNAHIPLRGWETSKMSSPMKIGCLQNLTTIKTIIIPQSTANNNPTHSTAHTKLTYEIVKHWISIVRLRNHVFGVEYAKLRAVFKWMHHVAQVVQHTTQRLKQGKSSHEWKNQTTNPFHTNSHPNVQCFVDRKILIKIDHLWRAVHRSCVSVELKERRERVGMRLSNGSTHLRSLRLPNCFVEPKSKIHLA